MYVALVLDAMLAASDTPEIGMLKLPAPSTARAPGALQASEKDENTKKGAIFLLDFLSVRSSVCYRRESPVGVGAIRWVDR